MLSDLFSEAQSPRIDWEGALAYAIYEISPAPNELTIALERFKENPVQGLKIKAQGAKMIVNGQAATEMEIWTDTAPSSIPVSFVERKPKSVFKIWNIWRGKVGGADVPQAWLGNAAMRVHDHPSNGELTLSCSDGEGKVDFENLVATLRIK